MAGVSFNGSTERALKVKPTIMTTAIDRSFIQRLNRESTESYEERICRLPKVRFIQRLNRESTEREALGGL